MNSEDRPVSETTTLPATTLPLEEIVKHPLPGMAIPGAFAFSPDDTLITYLFSPEGTLTRQLYAFDPQAGEQRLLVRPPAGGTTEENVSLAEALRRERRRQLEVGVTEYTWAKETGRLLVPLPEGIYLSDGPDQPLRKLVDGGQAPLLDPQFSPDGKWVAYVQEAELYIVSTASLTDSDENQPRQLTHGARETGKTHGLAEYIAQEEMGRSQGFWWSLDGKWLAFTEVDERDIPIYRIVHQGQDQVGEGAQEDHRYPFAGTANAKVRLGVVSIEGIEGDEGDEGREPVWMNLTDDDDQADIYLARVEWLPDGNLSAQLENRAQTTLELVSFDPTTGQRRTLLYETNEIWINLHNMFKPLKSMPAIDKAAKIAKGEFGFIWASEQTGFCHLYLYDQRGNLIRVLTKGDWMVDDIVGLDEAGEQVYFTATQAGPTESQLYAVSLAGGEPRRITPEAGTHTVVLDHGARRFIDIHQALDKPPAVTLRSLVDGSVLCSIYDEPDPRVAELALQPPELVTLQSRDNFTLYGALYRPPASFGEGPHPTIISVYGGPHAQLVTDSWRTTIAMRAQYLSRLGFLVFTLDNRGSARRGLAFEGALKYKMGGPEVEDQVDGVRWLVEQGLTSPQRVGIYGWSYGGYMAAMCLAQAADIFKVAVAGAPVTHWDGYDTHYTEHYMGTPQTNPKGYAAGSVMHHIEHIRGNLLLIHGLIDENVHFRHTARLIKALIKARKPYDLLLFPDERHTPRKPADRIFMEEGIRDYFLQHL